MSRAQSLSVVIDAAAIRRLPELAECAPGFSPLEYNVLVASPLAPERVGGIIMPDSIKEAEEVAAQCVLLVASSPLAFRFEGRWGREDTNDTSRLGSQLTLGITVAGQATLGAVAVALGLHGDWHAAELMTGGVAAVGLAAAGVAKLLTLLRRPFAKGNVSSLACAPEPGAVVVIGRYAGREWQGADGRLYRTLKDRDVAAVVHPDVVASARGQGA